MGVADGAVELTEPKGAKTWGFLLMNGCVHAGTSANVVGVKGKQVSEPLVGSANGATIKVQADMDRRTLSFAVNGGELVDAGVQLSAQVRPWALMCFPGDKCQLELSE